MSYQQEIVGITLRRALCITGDANPIQFSSYRCADLHEVVQPAVLHMRLTNVNWTMCKTTVKLVRLRHKESAIDIQASRIVLTMCMSDGCRQ